MALAAAATAGVSVIAGRPTCCLSLSALAVRLVPPAVAAGARWADAGVGPAALGVIAGYAFWSVLLCHGAFQELAGKADKIGQLNISPDLLRELMNK